MSSYPVDDPEKTVIKSKLTVTQETIVTATGELDAETEEEIAAIAKDINKIGRGILKYLEGFRTFILRGNVVDLAIGIVIGAAFTAVVNALVKDLITPLIPVSNTANSTSNLSNWTVSFSYITLHIGDFINAIISFLIVAAVLYFFVVQPVNSLMKLYHPKEATPETRECPYCFQNVNIKATRCPFCTSHLSEEKNHEEKEPVLILPDSLEKLSETLAENIAKKASAKLESAAGGKAAASTEETPKE